MKRRVMVTWTCSEQIEVDIPDGKFTEDEIQKIVDKAAEEIMPQYPDDSDWEWEGSEPAAKDSPSIPIPDDCWFEAGGYTVATNGYAVIVKGCPIEFQNHREWRQVKNADGLIVEIFSSNFAALPPHCGWFSNIYRPFLGCRVLGKTPTAGINGNRALGYVLDGNNNLIAVLMPAPFIEGQRDPEDYFQFNSN